jgi:hypothetical protein
MVNKPELLETTEVEVFYTEGIAGSAFSDAAFESIQ